MRGPNCFSSIYRTHWISGSLRRGPGQNNIGAAHHLTIFGNAPLDTLSMSRQIKQYASILWSAENQIWSIFIPLPNQLSSSVSVLVVMSSICLFSLQPRQIRELDKFSVIFVFFTQMLYLVSNVGVIGPQELLLHLSAMIARRASWSSPAECCFGIFALSFPLSAVLIISVF